MRSVMTVVDRCCSPKLSLGYFVGRPCKIQYHVPDRSPAGCRLENDSDGLIALVFPFVHGPVEPLNAAAALLALVLGVVAVDYGIHPCLLFRPAEKARSLFGC